jgi:aerobic carbon-monoxide dehydrogenase small subunit
MEDKNLIEIEFTVNGNVTKLKVRSNETLLDVLRSRLKLTGSKRGCNRGECGACTVLINGKPVNSCLILAPKAGGKEILTIEGLGSPEKLHPLQKAFIENNAVQCGFCTPGMIMSAKALMDENPNPTRENVRKAISGNLCRCTGYIPIMDAILEASKKNLEKE